jgi:hypothetical protein
MHVTLIRISDLKKAEVAQTVGLDDRGVGVQVTTESRILISLGRPDQLRGIHPTSYLMNSGGSSSEDKAAGE